MFHKKLQSVTHIGLIVAMLVVFMIPMAPITEATTYITTASDAMSSSKITTGSNHDIRMGLTTIVGAGGTISYTFPSGFTMTSVNYNSIDFALGNSSNCSTATYTEQTLAATAAAGTWGAAISGQVLTITSGTGVTALNNCVRLLVGTNASYGIAGTFQITNPTPPTAYTISIATTGGVNLGEITVDIITDDQVAVSGLVSQSMSFALSSNSVALNTLSTGTTASSSHTLTIQTNAGSGMAVTVSGNTLTSGSNTISACTACASTVNTEQFGINLVDNTTPNVGTAASGTTPIASAASGYATADIFNFASGDTVASSSAGINSTIMTVSYIANIAGATEAGSYTTTLTYTATATF